MNNLNIIGKVINIIEMHDFLDQIGVGQVISEMHNDSILVLKKFEKAQTVTYKGVTFTEDEFKNALREEEGILAGVSMMDSNYGPEAVVSFKSKNTLRISLQSQDQFAQIYDFLIDYEPKKKK